MSRSGPRTDLQSVAEALTLGFPQEREPDGQPVRYSQFCWLAHIPSRERSPGAVAAAMHEFHGALHAMPRPDAEFAAIVGGTDSGIVAAITKPARIYTVRSRELPDDWRYAGLVGEEIGADVRILNLAPDADEIERAAPHILDATRYPRAANMYPLCKLAQAIKEDGYRHVVTGQGGDEYFQAYGYARGRLYQLALAARNRNRIGRALLNLVRGDGSRLYSYAANPKTVANPLWRTAVLRAFKKRAGLGPHPYGAYAYPDLVQDYLLNVPLQFLVETERAVFSRFGVQAHQPLLAPRIAEAVAALPYKVRLTPDKKVFREAAKRDIPQALYERTSKRGFTVTSPEWVERNAARIRAEALEDPQLTAVIDSGKLARTVDQATLWFLDQHSLWRERG